jgi:hypothetical protein
LSIKSLHDSTQRGVSLFIVFPEMTKMVEGWVPRINEAEKE